MDQGGSLALDGHLTLDDTAQTLALAQFADALYLSGGSLATSSSWLVTVTFAITSPYATGAVASTAQSLTLTVKNPCVDTNFVTIAAPADARARHARSQ